MKWKTKSVLYDYKLNQCFAFFLFVLTWNVTSLITFLIIYLFHSLMFIWLKIIEQSPNMLFH